MKEQNLIKNENYITIQGFMVNELNLKGNELLIYAIIYGFSQTNGNEFTGSLQYLANWTNSTKYGVQKCLKSLIEKNLILKSENIINNIKFCYYKVTRGMQQSCIPCNKVDECMQQSCTNNINIIKENNNISNDILFKRKKKKEFEPPTLEEVEKYCKEKKFIIDFRYFYEYYSVAKWTDAKGDQVLNWKQKMITWNKKALDKQEKPKSVHNKLEEMLREEKMKNEQGTNNKVD